MINSIQQFLDEGIKNLQEAARKFSSSPSDMAGFIRTVQEECLRLATDFIGEVFTTGDEILRESNLRKEHWEVVRTDSRTLLTSIGAVNYSKTMFKNKETGERKYLVDDFLGISPHERMTEDAVAAMLEEAVETSYRKAGENVSIMDSVSKQTVKEKIHSLEFPPEMKRPGRKRIVEYLFVDADEDHVSLQFHQKKGDLRVSESGRKQNGMINKLVYVYEGIEPEAPKSKRHRLVNPHYFSGAYEGKENAVLWDEVYAYIDNNYDISRIKKIYLGADGGAWIKAGSRRLHGVTYVLDEFHLRKYLIRMTNHLLDSADDARKLLCDVIRENTKEDFLSCVDMLYSHAKTEQDNRNIKAGEDYILENWTAAKVRLTERKELKGCSAEGHVSHVLSSRMSMKPLGWSRHGADRMAHLCAYKWNGGDMLELVRYQKEALPLAAGAEDEADVLSASEIIHSEQAARRPVWAKYVDSMQVELSVEMKKWMSIGMNNFIWRLT